MRDLLLRITFVDGTTDDADLHNFLKGRQAKGTVFEPLRDTNVFAQVVWSWAPCNGPMVPTSLLTPCMTRSKSMAAGSSNEDRSKIKEDRLLRFGETLPAS
jgi:hypothetical protein